MKLNSISILMVIILVAAVALPVVYYFATREEEPPPKSSQTVLPTNSPPVARFTMNATRILHGQEVYFDGSASLDPDRDPLLYRWEFGDGENSSGVAVAHQFLTDGTYKVSLTVSDGRLEDTTSKTLEVDNAPPVIRSYLPAADLVFLRETQSAQFSVVASDADGDALSCAWSVNGRPVPGNGPRYNLTTDHNSSGEYAVRVVVSDDADNATRDWTVSVRNVNRPPLIDSYSPGGNVKMDEGATVNFTAVAYDPDADNLTYVWVLDDQVNESGSGERAAFSYRAEFEGINANGTHGLRVTFLDGSSQVSLNWTVLVRNVNRPPVIDLANCSPDPSEPVVMNEEEKMNFTVEASDLDQDLLTNNWTLDNIAAGDHSSHFNFNTNYSSSGSYRLKVEVSDGQFADSVQWNITVLNVNRAPAARARADPASAYAGQNFTFNGSLSSDPDGDELGFSWDFGDGGLGEGSTAVHAYRNSGQYRVGLTVTDPGGRSSNATLTVNVTPGLEQAWKLGPVAQPPRSLLVEDVDADGRKELVVAEDAGEDGNQVSHGRLSIYDLLTRTLEWNSTDIGSPSKIVATNLDGDPQLELVVGVTTLRLGDAAGSQWQGKVLIFDGRTHAVDWQGAELGSITAVAVTDLDGDSQKELLAGYRGGFTLDSNTNLMHEEGGLAIYSSSFSLLWTSTGWGNTTLLAAAQFDKEASIEVAVFTAHLVDLGGGGGSQTNISTFRWRNGDLTRLGEFSAITYVYPSALEVVDVDRDGGMEIIFGDSRYASGAYSGYVYALRSTAAPMWKTQNIGGVLSLLVANVDTSSSANEILIGLAVSQDGGGLHGRMLVYDLAWSELWRSGDIGHVTSLAAADINGDGKMEILAGAMTSDDGAGNRNSALHVFSAPDRVEIISVSGFHHLGAGLLLLDADSDGLPEVLFADWDEAAAAGQKGYVYLYGIG